MSYFQEAHSASVRCLYTFDTTGVCRYSSIDIPLECVDDVVRCLKDQKTLAERGLAKR